MTFFQRVITDVLDIVCPESCLSCGCHLKADEGQFLCPECWAEYERTDCSKDKENIITKSFNSEDIEIVDGCTFLKFDKKETTQKILHNIKYFNHPELGVKFGKIAGHQLKKYRRFNDVNYILPVPMHPDKQKKRGYNQAEKIAEGLSEVLNIPIKNDILHKNVNTESQTRMNKVQRLKNSTGVYSADRVEELCEKHFLIVDDVFTTGATLEVCAKALHSVMPECKISVFALAKA